MTSYQQFIRTCKIMEHAKTLAALLAFKDKSILSMTIVWRTNDIDHYVHVPHLPTSGWRLRPLIIWRYVVPGTHIGSKTCQLRVVWNCRWSIDVCRLHYRRIMLVSTTHPLTCSLLSCTHLLKSHICGGDWSQSNGTASHAAAAAIEASCSVT